MSRVIYTFILTKSFFLFDIPICIISWMLHLPPLRPPIADWSDVGCRQRLWRRVSCQITVGVTFASHLMVLNAGLILLSLKLRPTSPKMRGSRRSVHPSNREGRPWRQEFYEPSWVVVFCHRKFCPKLRTLKLFFLFIFFNMTLC